MTREGLHTLVSLLAQPPDVEAAGRRLLTALDALAVGYPQNYEAWRQQQDEKEAVEKRRRDESNAPYQAILDGLMDEYRSSGR